MKTYKGQVYKTENGEYKLFGTITEYVDGIPVKRYTIAKDEADIPATQEQIDEYNSAEQKKEIDTLFADYVEYHNYLNNTDWIITKINEANIKGESIEGLKVQYSEELNYRDVCRENINLLEGSNPDFKDRYKNIK